ERDKFFQQLREHGSARNFEAKFRSRGGELQPHLISASIIDYEGAPHVVAVVRNIALMKRTENELRAAREELSAQVEALTSSQRRLQMEIAERAQAERRLRISETKLRKVFDASLDAVTIRRIRDDRLIDFNPAFLKATGYSRGEAMAHAVSELNVWGDLDKHRVFYNELRARGYVRNLEAIYRTKSGQLVPSLLSGVVLELEGEPCVVVVARDNTKYKHAERELIGAHEALSAQVTALRESQRRLQSEIIRHRQVIAQREQAEMRARQSEATLRQVFDTSTDSITIRRLSDHKFVDVNEGFVLITGYTREEVVGKTPGEISLWVDQQRAREFLEQLCAQGSIRNWADNIRMRDGAIIPFLLSAALIRMGDEPCVVVMARDIREIKKTESELISAREALSARVRALRDSQIRLQAAIVQREGIMAEREQAEKKVQESELKLRTIFDASLDSISLRRLRDKCYIDVNREFLALTGYSREEVIGNLAMNETLWRADQTRSFTEVLQRDGFTRDFEATLRCKDGATIPVMTSAAVVAIDGEPCALALSRDITQIKLAEQALIAAREEALSASRAKSEFLSSMSHEIRTPMNAILGMADLLWETSLGAHQRRYLETMRANGDALLDLINHVLDLTKIESGQLTLETAPFDLNDLIERTAETLGIRAHEKGLELVARITPGVPLTVTGDPLRLRQILINLLGNAIKFTERGQVILTVEKEPRAHTALSPEPVEWFRFSVADTGVGIPENKLSAIFSSFTQADSSITRRYGGTGLGLAIVKRLVELHRGSLAVESRMGLGSTFHFTIPLALREQADDSRPPQTLAGVRALIADDSPVNRLLIREVMTSRGASVAEASGGEEAIAIAEAVRESGNPFDLVLLDSRMPETDGFKAAARLQSSAQAHPQTPAERIILMLTTDDLASSLEALRELRLDAYLVKPIRRTDLIEVAAAGAGGTRAAPVKSPANASRLEPLSKAPLKILVAEDSTDNRLLIEAYLRSGNFEMDEAENGEVAINKFISRRYDIVLMDVQMPLVDGYTAVRAIRQWEARHQFGRTSIIALTASALDEAIHRSLEAGCDAHVSKPVKRTTLLEAIYEAIRRSAEAGSDIGAAKSVTLNGAAHAGTSAIVVEVPEELCKLMPGFISRKRDEAVELRTAIERRDFETITNIGHRIKGEGGSYGLDRVSEIGAALEESAKLLDGDGARRLTDVFADYIGRIEIIYGKSSAESS
ncbi:MAG: PAS domain S-box protein, partial [Candidatus Binataceae bacterium]